MNTQKNATQLFTSATKNLLSVLGLTFNDFSVLVLIFIAEIAISNGIIPHLPPKKVMDKK